MDIQNIQTTSLMDIKFDITKCDIYIQGDMMSAGSQSYEIQVFRLRFHKLDLKSEIQVGYQFSI
jgi:hypothetical protein